jgi:hypothetical protein
VYVFVKYVNVPAVLAELLVFYGAAKFVYNTSVANICEILSNFNVD